MVAPGLLYADVETDKATIEWESQEDGFIAKLLVGDGAQNIEVRQEGCINADSDNMGVRTKPSLYLLLNV